MSENAKVEDKARIKLSEIAYEVLEPIKHDGRKYVAGGEIMLNSDAAASLIENNIIKIKETK